MLHQRAVEVVCFALLAAIGVRLAAAQVTCYTSTTGCTSTSFSISGSNPAGQCCVSRGGLSYKTGTAACKACVVYGFFANTASNTPLTNISHKEGSQLNVYFGYVNGSLTGSQAVSFSVPESYRYIKAFASGVTNSNKNSRVQFGLNVLMDNIALEPPLLVSVTATVANSNEFVIPFSITILDADVLTIGFRETDYYVTEGEGQYPPIKLAKDKRIARPLSVQVVPMRVDQFRLLNISLPTGITYADLPNPAQYNPNGLQEFDYTPQNLTFNTTQNDDVISPMIRIVEDQINDAEQQFICIVKVFDTSLITSGSVIIGHPSVVIRIVDDDIISIGFEFPLYTFTKGVQVFYPDTIRLVKDGVSKQTFMITLTAEASAVSNQAVYGENEDYDIGRAPVQTYSMTPDQQYLNIPIYINNNDAVKGMLQAILVSVRVPNTPVYNTPRNPTTTIIILDNNVAIVGFVNDAVTVTEGDDLTECVAVTQPTPDVAMWLSFYLNVDFIPLTADTSDVSVTSDVSTIIIGPYDNVNRIVCFTVAALPDVYFEGNQTFQYFLSLASDQPSVVVSPNTTTVTILDNTTLTIGFVETEYAVNGSQSYVTFKVSILGDVWIQGINVGVMFSTEDGTAQAGQDYSQTSQLLIFNDTSTDFLVTVEIINNGYCEDDRTFRAILALMSADGYQQFVTISPYLATATIIHGFQVVYLIPTEDIYVVKENQNQAAVCFVAAPAAAVPVDVTVVATEDDVPSARSPQNFIANSLRLTIPPNTPPLSEQCVAFSIVDNKVALEPNKTFSIKVQTPPKVILVRPPGHVLIVDEDAVSVNFTSSNYTSVESGSTAVCVSKDAMTATNITVEITLTSVGSCRAYGDITPVIYTAVLVAGPAGAAACVNVTNDLWVGRSAFQVSITKVISAGGIAKVGVPSRASVVIYNAGCAVNEYSLLCRYVFQTGLCQRSIYYQLCCRTCGTSC